MKKFFKNLLSCTSSSKYLIFLTVKECLKIQCTFVKDLFFSNFEAASKVTISMRQCLIINLINLSEYSNNDMLQCVCVQLKCIKCCKFKLKRIEPTHLQYLFQFTCPAVSSSIDNFLTRFSALKNPSEKKLARVTINKLRFIA